MAKEATGKLECDLVMRGGITSGIVYPRAIAKLAETYTFRAIGGTSAGAIAAAGTAAAAYGARNGVDRFQDRIKGLPRELGTKVRGKTKLERLFQPQPETRRLFRLLMAGLGHETKTRTVTAMLMALLANYWLYALIGALFAFVPALLYARAMNLDDTAFWTLLVMGLVPASFFAFFAALAFAVRDGLVRIPRNRYGLCSGSSNNLPDEAGVLPLTDWLNDFFQTLAGKKRDDPPVTFGDLWGTNDEEAERDIDLVLTTTNVTRGVSQRFPFLEGSWGQLFFRKEDFEQLFPASVVEHLCGCDAKARHADVVDVRGFYPLPAPADLPVLLGARMSLSFPFLLSAVPLYAANFEAKKQNGKVPLERCWFSDGGLTSNFPLHFFDTPLPKRPTFGINLIPHDVEASEVEEEEQILSRVGGVGFGGVEDGKVPKEWRMIWMPSRNASGIRSAARFNKFEGENNETPSIAGFFFAMFDTARNWGDTELLAMPGYRDRVVHVKLAGDEGGMNLKMDGTKIEEIGDRGERAGELLAARFAPDPGKDPQSGEGVQLTWDNHRWIRYRAAMAGLELHIQRFRDAWYFGQFRKLLNRHKADAPSYAFANGPQQSFARTATKQVLAAAGAWKRTCKRQTLTFDRYDDKTDGRSPRPKPILRMMPPGSNDPRAERPD